MTTHIWAPSSTRLSPPMLGSSAVDRPRLIDLLDRSVAASSLTLVLGYPGAGKSTLLAEWLQSHPHQQAAWLSCDDSEIDPNRFWQAVVAALRRVDAALGTDLLDAIELEGEVSRQAIASLVDDLAAIPAPIVLILDDLHRASSPRLWPLLSAFLEWLPIQHRVVVSSRTDPVLPLHRWRIEGRVAELRNADLAFRGDEVTDLLGALGVEVDTPTTQFLTTRTEGWAAGLQLAALNVRDHEDANQFLREFAATDRHLVDYLIGEVLDRQPADVVDFLLATAVLRELTGDVCEALTGDARAGQRLIELEAQGLFLIPLDRDRRRYRYHHLFAEMLRNRLRHDDLPRKLELHRAAAAWYGAHGDVGRAVHHAVRGQDVAQAIALLRENVVDTYFARGAVPLDTIVDVIDPATLAAERALALEFALAIGMAGALDEAGVWLRQLRAATPATNDEFDIRLAAAESMLDMAQGRAESALSTIARIRLANPAERPAPLQLDNTTIRCLHYLDDIEGVRRLASAPGNLEPFAAAVRAAAHAGIEFEAGNLDVAEQVASAAIRAADEFGTRNHFAVADASRVAAAVAIERGLLDPAQALLEVSLHTVEGKRPVVEALCLVDQAALLAESGRVDEAFDVFALAEQIVVRLAPSTQIAERVAAAHARLHLLVGAVQRAADLTRTISDGPRRSLLDTRVALARRRHDDADKALGQLDTRGWPRYEIESALLAAQLGLVTNRPPREVEAAIERALVVADQQRFLRTVLLEAESLGDALERVLRRAESGSHRAAIADAARVRLPISRETVRTGSSLDLSEREHEVLRYLATQMSNREIASELYVSLNTMKTHVRSLYRKLDAATRSQAVETGRNRGLI